MIVVVIPIKDGKFLMVHNPNRGWEFPGGKIERGEKPEDAALRESREEAGIIFENLEMIGKEGNMILFKGEVKDVLGGEMNCKFFSKLPQELSFPRDEAIRFLRMAGINI